MTQPPDRGDVNELPAKLSFLMSHKEARRKHGLSMAALSEKCGQSRNWLKTAKDPNRYTQSIARTVERRLAALCGFDPEWPAWRKGTAKDFQSHFLKGVTLTNQGLQETDESWLGKFGHQG